MSSEFVQGEFLCFSIQPVNAPGHTSLTVESSDHTLSEIPTVIHLSIRITLNSASIFDHNVSICQVK